MQNGVYRFKTQSKLTLCSDSSHISKFVQGCCMCIEVGCDSYGELWRLGRFNGSDVR